MPSPRVIMATVVFAWLACAQALAGESRTIASGEGRAVEVRDTSRIVTIGSAVTEIVFALGHGEQVVAVDLTSTFPSAVRSKPNVGYMRALSAEGVMSLAPTLILATEGAGPPDTIEVLSRAGVPLVIIPEGYDEDAVIRKVRLVAEVLGEEKRGAEMIQTIAQDFDAVESLRKRIADRRKGIFVFAIGNGAPTVGGNKTSADGILQLAGIENAMKAVNGFKPAVAESTLAAQPDVVITMMERDHGLDADTMFSLPAFAGTPAARDKRLVPISSSYLAFGPRTAHAAYRLAAAVYPELSLPPLPPRAWTQDDPGAKQ